MRVVTLAPSSAARGGFVSRRHECSIQLFALAQADGQGYPQQGRLAREQPGALILIPDYIGKRKESGDG